MSHQVTLYVKSKKTAVKNVQEGYQKITPIYNVGSCVLSDASTPYSVYDVKTSTEYDFLLPEDQQRMLEDINKIASEYGFKVEVVDLAKKNALTKYRLEHSEKIKNLPSLVNDSGEIAEGVLTKEQIEAFLSKTAKTNSLSK